MSTEVWVQPRLVPPTNRPRSQQTPTTEQTTGHGQRRAEGGWNVSRSHRRRRAGPATAKCWLGHEGDRPKASGGHPPAGKADGNARQMRRGRDRLPTLKESEARRDRGRDRLDARPGAAPAPRGPGRDTATDTASTARTDGRSHCLGAEDDSAARTAHPTSEPAATAEARKASVSKSRRSDAVAALASLAPPTAVLKPARRCLARETCRPSGRR